VQRRYTGEIIASRPFGRCVELVLETAARFDAEPGQFVHVRCEGAGLILRRPYSICHAGEGAVSLLVQVVGAGSAWLAAAEVGSRLDVLGPLGRGFNTEASGRYTLIAGGAGIAPIRFLASRLRDQGRETVVFWGMETVDEYRGLSDVLMGECDLRLVSMDGSAGCTGNVIDTFKRSERGDIANICACGPRGMLSALAECIDEDTLACLQVCMEERMACGIGACRGCAVPAVSPRGGYLAVCKDGPVFWGRELDWKRLSG
jgi:dihydroorotate dehydrogenase electron transfer subunit